MARPTHGSTIEPLEVERQTRPDYPNAARKQKVEGKVMVAALVCEHGYVVEARVKESDSPLLELAALEAVSRWHFRPSAPPAPCWVETPVTFQLH